MAKRKKKKKKNEDELKEAGEHLVRATIEGIIGAGLAIKGFKGLMKESEGRNLVIDLSGRIIGLGLGFMMSLPEVIKEVRETKSKRNKTPRKKSRKIKID